MTDDPHNRKTVQLCLKLNGSVIKLHAITNLPSWRNKYKQVRGRNELLYSWKLFFDYLEQSLSNQLSKAEKETTTIIIDACLARPKKKKVIKNHRQHHLSLDFNLTRLQPFRFPYHAHTNLLPSFVNTIFAQVNSNLIHSSPSMFEIEI